MEQTDIQIYNRFRQRSRRNLAGQAQTLVSSKVYSHGYGLPFLNLDSTMSRLLVGKFVRPL